MVTFTNSASIIISTCRDSIFNVEKVFFDVINIIDEIIVVHQLLDHDDLQSFSIHRDFLLSKYHKLKIIVDPGSGLSRSRNIGMVSVKSDIFFISDDDNHFIPEGVIYIRKYMDSNSADVVLGSVISPEGEPFKDYSNLKKYVDIRSSGSVSSIEMCIRTKFIRNNSINFNEKFGLGTSLPSCEEFIFLNETIKSQAQIVRVDSYINVHPLESSGKDFSNINILMAKGAAFKHVFGLKGIFVCIYFSLSKSVSFIDFLYLSKNILLGYLK